MQNQSNYARALKYQEWIKMKTKNIIKHSKKTDFWFAQIE